jgi:hypothetical protein
MEEFWKNITLEQQETEGVEHFHVEGVVGIDLIGLESNSVLLDKGLGMSEVRNQIIEESWGRQGSYKVEKEDGQQNE